MTDAAVRHRIDGLEIQSLDDAINTAVRHRIDGLEKTAPR